MLTTISQLESEFNFDVMQVSATIEDNVQNEVLLIQI